MSLKDVCKKLDLNKKEAKRMIVSHHELESLLSKDEIKTVKGIEISFENLQLIKKVAKELKISDDAVICGILKGELKPRQK